MPVCRNGPIMEARCRSRPSTYMRIRQIDFPPPVLAAQRDARLVFFAPALPVGNEFTGIVYLHGSVDRPANRLVLTDSDFGRAYITDGWATRFLERLFSRFVVLFVGYSHQDMLLTYLARGVTAGSP